MANTYTKSEQQPLAQSKLPSAFNESAPANEKDVIDAWPDTVLSQTWGEVVKQDQQFTQVGSQIYTSGGTTINNQSFTTQVTGGGAKTATFVVGPSSNDDSDSYDYVTDGTNDDVQIQAAIDALPATGGMVLLREGTYTINYTGAAEISSTTNGVHLMGMGRGTVLKFENGINDGAQMVVLSGSYCKVSNIFFDFNLSNANVALADPVGALYIGYGGDVSGCYFSDGAGYFIAAEDSTHIHNNIFFNFDGTFYDYAITPVSTSRIYVSNNIFAPTATTYFVCVGNDTSSEIHVVNNFFDAPASSEAMFAANCDQVIANKVSTGGSYSAGTCINGCTVVSDNLLYLDCLTTLPSYAIYGSDLVANNVIFMGTSDIDFVAVGGSQVVSGNFIDGCGTGIEDVSDVCSGNFITSFAANGISISGDRVVCSNNKIGPPAPATDNLYSGILLATNIDHCVITNNLIKGDTAGNDLKYCISEATGCDYNIIEHNVATGADTAQISIVGANTISANNITA